MGTRIPDPEPGELRADVESLLPLIAGPSGKPASTMVVLARSPDLLSPFLGWAAALALNGVLPKRDHEILALRAAHNCGSKFEFDEHSDFARDAGFTDAEIAAVRRPMSEGDWSASEQALLHAADELCATHDVAQETWEVLASYYDQPALVEIVFVVGQYTMLSMVANAAGIDAS